MRYESDVRDQSSEIRQRVNAMISMRSIDSDNTAGEAVVYGREANGGDAREVDTAEVFSNHGFHSRPGVDDEADAVTVFIGGSNDHPVVVATRDPRVADVIADVGLANDETVIYNSAAAVIIRSNGDIEIRSRTGSAAPVATLADIQGLRDWILSTMVIATPSGNSTPGTVNTPPTAAGTQVLRAE